MGKFLDAVKGIFTATSLPTLATGFAIGAMCSKNKHNKNVWGLGFDNKGNYDGYIGSGSSCDCDNHHDHYSHYSHRRGNSDYKDFKDFKDFQKYQDFLDYKYGDRDNDRFNHCSMRDIQTRPYEMRRDWRNGPKAGGLTIGTGDDGNIFIGGDLKGKKVTIYQ